MKQIPESKSIGEMKILLNLFSNSGITQFVRGKRNQKQQKQLEEINNRNSWDKIKTITKVFSWIKQLN